jgi:hypothetical protein
MDYLRYYFSNLMMLAGIAGFALGRMKSLHLSAIDRPPQWPLPPSAMM